MNCTNQLKKINIATLYNQNETYVTQSRETYRESQSKIDKFKELLQQKIIPIDKLKQIAWEGVPSEMRSQVWKVLIQYQSPNRDANFTLLEAKRNQYYEMCEIYFGKDQQHDERERTTFKLIQGDVKRTLPDALLFRNLTIQGMLDRILFIWNIRNPACGYVQGINDVVTPYLVIFLQDYVDIDLDQMKFINEQQIDHLDQRLLRQVEADTYWCLRKLLESVLDNYTYMYPGIARYYLRLKGILNVLDKPLLQHLADQQIDFHMVIFKWSNCLFLRLFSFQVGLRLFDTFMAEEQNYFSFSLYLVVTIVMRFSKKMQKLNFEEIMELIERLPTKKWTEDDLNLCLAEAYTYQNIFQNK